MSLTLRIFKPWHLLSFLTFVSWYMCISHSVYISHSLSIFESYCLIVSFFFLYDFAFSYLSIFFLMLYHCFSFFSSVFISHLHVLNICVILFPILLTLTLTPPSICSMTLPFPFYRQMSQLHHSFSFILTFYHIYLHTLSSI